MTDWCNFKCPYCITGNYDKPLIPISVLLERAKKINHIINQVPTDKKIRLHFIGGEVTYYNLIQILEYINLSRVDTLNLITNFSQSIGWFKKIIDFLYSSGIQLTLVASYHASFGTKDNFIDKLRLIKEYESRINLLASVVIDENYDISFLHSLKNIGVKLNLSLLRTCTNNSNITISDKTAQVLNELDDKKSYITNYIYTDRKRYSFGTSAAANNQIFEGGLIADGYWCTAGSTTVRILPNGNVVGAGCYYCQKNVILGNIDKDDIKILTEPIQCHLSEDKRCNFCYKLNIVKNLED